MKKFLFLCIAGCLCLSIPHAYAQRDPLKWPFSKTSIWNMPIHNEAQYVPAGIQDAVNFEVDEDVIIMTPNEPLMNIETNYTGWSAGGDARCADQGPTLFSAPIPQSYIFSNAVWHGNTPNSGASILLPNGKIKQTQPFAKCSTTLATSQYVWNENDCVITGECIVGAHGGSHLSAIGGALRVGELTAGEIKHVLKLNLFGKENFYNGNGGYRWPATTADGGYDDPGAGNYYGGTNPEMRIGALLAIHKDAVLESVSNNSLGLETEAALIIARALQNYGGYTVDNTAWDTYGLITEIGPAGRVSDEFKALYGHDMNAYGNLDIPWARDIKRLFTNLYVISNNDQSTIGGGPVTDETNRRAPMAPDFLPAQTFKIMPLGDSKTEGGGGGGQQSSWRGFLRTKLIRAGYKIDYVGDRQNLADGDTIPNDYDHAGHGGYTIGPDINTFCSGCETTGIYEHIQNYLPAANPDVVLLAIGVNDMFNAQSHPANYAATAPQRYRALVNKILQLKPNVRIIVSTIEPVKWDINWGGDPNDNNIGALNAAIKALADSSATDNIFFADIRNRMLVNYGPGDFFDDIHLSQQGARKNADAWFDALTPVLMSTPNNAAPTCSITSPANSAAFDAPATITIEATATDSDGTVTKVEFFNGATKIGEDTSPPFIFTWSNVDEGTYSITAQAIDDLYGTASSTITINVASTDGYIKFDGTGIGSPGSYGNSGLTFAKALDGDASTFFDAPSPNGQWVGLDLGVAKIVKKVRYIPRNDWAARMVDGKIQGANTIDFSDAVDLFTLTAVPAEGIYTVSRFENEGLYQYYRFLSPDNGYGNVAELEFWGDPNGPVNEPPTVSLTSPANNANYIPGANILLSATASDADGTITKVEYYNGLVLIGTDTLAPYSLVWENVPAGTYLLKAKATDNAGVSKTSDAVTISLSTVSGNGLYSEDFNTNTSVGWIANGGVWTAGNQRYENTDWNGEFSSFYNGATFTNYTYQVDAVAIWNNDIGFLFNYVDGKNYYNLVINTNSKTASLKKNINGTISTVATASFTGNGTGSSHAISIRNTGTSTTININDAIVFDNISTTEITSGKIGLYAFYCPSNFDNVLVTSNNGLPIVSITAPVSGSVFQSPATLELSATASDSDGSISKVDFYQGSTLIGTDSISPFTVTWTDVVAGNYIITAIATDNEGSSVVSSGVSIVVNAQAAESVTFSNPPAVVNIGTTQTVNVNYVANVDRIIDLYLFDSNWQAIASKNVYVSAGSGVQSIEISIPANAAAATNGIWFANLWATDWSSAVTSTFSFGVTVNAPPTVSLTSPVSGSVYTAPGTVELSASATDADGTVTKVEFYAGSTLLHVDTEAPFTYTWSAVAAGSYSVTAVGEDNTGARVSSAPVSLTVNAPVMELVAFNNPPTVMTAGNTYTVNVDYVATESRIIDLYLYTSNWQYIASRNVYINAGTGTQAIQITVPAGTTPFTNGIWSANLWAADWSGIVKSSTYFGVSVNAAVPAKLNLTSMCSNNPAATRRWRVTSTFNEPVQFAWSVYGTTQTGTATVDAQGTIYFETITVAGANTTIITYGATGKVTKASGGAACSNASAREGSSMREVADSLDEGVDFSVYPVPAYGEFTIQHHGFANPALVITNMMNAVVYEVQLNETKHTVSQNLPAGMYIITLREGMHIRHKKIIIK